MFNIYSMIMYVYWIIYNVYIITSWIISTCHIVFEWNDQPGARTVEIPFSSNAAALDDAEKGSQLPQKNTCIWL